jgi:hypothetical protein|tara:strand:+ start:819 stop:1388 length:570 start_codon:yes stop_codon:yes gene_type:complete
MKKLVLLFILLITSSCNNTKGVYWCGDHACINKKEKESYFKKTMIVEKKYIDQLNNKDNTDYEKILIQAKKNEKNRIINEKNLSKKTKYEIKKQLKEEKKRIKEGKKLAKDLRKEEKKSIKEGKKLAKELRKEEKKILNNKKKSTKQTKVVTNEPYKIEIKSNKFSELVDIINKKNALKKYPDINKMPD